MTSLYDDLAARIDADPRLTKMKGARFDLTLLLFNARGSIRELWAAAEATVAGTGNEGNPATERLKASVEALRPIFGERNAYG